MNQGPTLIIGASGFIGSQLCKCLAQRDRPFRRLIRNPQTEPPTSSELHVIWPEEAQKIDLSPFSAVVHLGVGQIKQSMTSGEIEREYLRPLEGLLEAINKTNPQSHLIFISSQSAYKGAPGKYGMMKFESEERIRRSGIHSTVIRPGLVFGPGSTGLVARMVRVFRISPVIPLPGGRSTFIQPVSVNQLTQAIMTILSEPYLHRNRMYQLAYPPLRFGEFAGMLEKALGRKRIYVPVPNWLVEMGLALLEMIFMDPPFTRSNWYGLTGMKKMDCDESWEALQIKLPHLHEELFRTMKT